MFKKIILFALIALSFDACKKEEDSQPTTLQSIYPSGGFIRGTVSGQRSNGSPFSFTFNHTFYPSMDNLYTDDNPLGSSDIYYGSIERVALGTLPINGSSQISFSLLSPISPYFPSDESFSCDVLSDLGNGQTLSFWADIYAGSFSNMSITNFNYNSSTRIATGDFFILADGTDNSTGYDATI
ncbi:MAG: hypothetical protein ACKO7B_13285, partial [Flavobacteriales bacterium]